MKNLFAALTLLLFANTQAAELKDGPLDQTQVNDFVEKMVQKHGFEKAWLQGLMDQARFRAIIVERYSAPAESLPWYKYRPIFMKDKRINGGAKFWKEHAATLARAEQEFGVPAQIIVAIIGVESNFGSNHGRIKVMDALSTLAFHYERRRKFGLSQLEEYLLLCREEGFDPMEKTGSYAGAMGQPQFIPSSYRHYTVDFDGDGKRDLWNSWEDIIGSVANYFTAHRWESGAPIARQADVFGNRYKNLLVKELKPGHTLGELKSAGVSIVDNLDTGQPARLLELELKKGVEHWATLHNFYVITRYNHSPLYAMAVLQLSEAIAEKYGAES